MNPSDAILSYCCAELPAVHVNLLTTYDAHCIRFLVSRGYDIEAVAAALRVPRTAIVDALRGRTPQDGTRYCARTKRQRPGYRCARYHYKPSKLRNGRRDLHAASQEAQSEGD